MKNEECVRFKPSKVEGLDDVIEFAVFPDRVEFQTATGKKTFRLFDLIKWQQPQWWRRLLYQLGWRRYYIRNVGWRPIWLPVGERDWFHPPTERFILFFTQPPITVYMPLDEPEDYHQSYFLLTCEVIRRGGFATVDLG